MSFTPIISALALPNGALVEQRVPKKLLLEQGAPTAADKRQIQDGIEEMIWVAALKPTNIGVPVFRDSAREYLEVAVLTVILRPATRHSRLIELIHRAIPYPVVLATEHRDTVNLSLAQKRWSQGEAGKVVIEDIREIELHPDTPDDQETAFLASLAVSALPAQDMFVLYDGLMARVAALEAARISGQFFLPESTERAAILRESLDTHGRLRRELAVLRASAAKEKQLNRRVELNLDIKHLETQVAEVFNTLRITPAQ